MSLLFIPGAMVFGSLIFFSTRNSLLIMIAYTITKMTHYAFSYPVRELLYIPTLKEIKFKSKSWIDAFGQKFAKSTGSTVNILATGMSESFFYPVLMLFFSGIIGLWFIVSFLLGIRYKRAVDNNEVIGFSKGQDGADG